MATKVDRRGNAHLESNLEEFFRKEVLKAGGRAFKWVPTIAGVPDRFVLWPGGHTFFVELKQEGEKPTAVQVVWHDRLRALGFRVDVLDTKDAVRAWLAEISST